MSQELIPANQRNLAPLRAEHEQSLASVDTNSKARNTNRVYEAALSEFENWLQANSYPADVRTIQAFLKELAKAGAKTSTIKLKRAAIASKYEVSRDKAVTACVKSIINERAEADADGDDLAHEANRSRSKDHIKLEDLRRMCETSPTGLKAMRDRALLLYTFWTASRRSEAVVLRVSDIEWKRDGAIITVRHSKTNRTGEEKQKSIPQFDDKCLCPVTALKAWLAAARITDGFVFRKMSKHGSAPVENEHVDAQIVKLVVKENCERIGLDPKAFSAHSLRSGLVTAASELGIDRKNVKNLTHHKTDVMLDHYDKRGAVETMQAVRAAVNQWSKDSK